MGWAFWLYLGNNKLKSKRAIKPIYMDLPPYTEEIGKNLIKANGALILIQRRFTMQINAITQKPYTGTNAKTLEAADMPTNI